jgi:hypothetical protein
MTRLGFQTRLPFDNGVGGAPVLPIGGSHVVAQTRSAMSNRKAVLDHRLANVLWFRSQAPVAGHEGRVAERGRHLIGRRHGANLNSGVLPKIATGTCRIYRPVA